jgi:hypothetical protein
LKTSKKFSRQIFYISSLDEVFGTYLGLVNGISPNSSKDAPVLTENQFPKIAFENLSKIEYGEVFFFTISRT